MSYLFLFTNSFPCNKALEHYIEHEMPFLAKNFDKVFIIPGDFGKIEIPIPSNVEVLDIYSKAYYKGNKFSFFRNLPLIISLYFFEFTNTKLGKWYWLSKTKTAIVTLNNAIETAIALHRMLLSKNISKSDCTFYSYWFYHSSLILAIAKKKGFIHSFISRGHQAEIYEEREPEKSLFKNIKLKYVNRVFLISEHAKNYLLTHYPKYASKYFVSYLGVKNHGVNPNEGQVFRIASCSKDAPHKRVHLIAEILKNLNFEYEWYHLGYIPDDKQRNFLEILKENKLKRVYFLGDYANEKVLEFYKNNHIDVFLNVSSIEGLSVALMEAGSFGITLMATDINGTAEIVNEKSGYLLPLEFNTKEAADILERIYTTSSYHKRASAREMFLERFDAEKNFNAFIQTIKSIS